MGTKMPQPAPKGPRPTPPPPPPPKRRIEVGGGGMNARLVLTLPGSENCKVEFREDDIVVLEDVQHDCVVPDNARTRVYLRSGYQEMVQETREEIHHLILKFRRGVVAGLRAAEGLKALPEPQLSEPEPPRGSTVRESRDRPEEDKPMKRSRWQRFCRWWHGGLDVAAAGDFLAGLDREGRETRSQTRRKDR